MLKRYIFTALFISLACTKRCYHKKCEISPDEYVDCDQESYQCIKWNAFGNGSCLDEGFPTIDGFEYCGLGDNCTTDPGTGQAACVKDIGKDNSDDDPLISDTVKIVLIAIGATFVLIVVFVVCCACLGIGCFKNQKPRFQRLSSIQRPLVENVEADQMATYPAQPTTEYPATQYPQAQLPSVHYPPVPASHHGGYAPGHPLTPGATVRLTSKAHGKNLRIHQNGAIDGRGGTGQWATFTVHGRGPHVALALQDHPNKFIAIKNNSLTHGTGGKFCTLIVKHHPGDGTISLESAEHRSQHVGILPNGDPKGPHHTGTGDHGKFYVN